MIRPETWIRLALSLLFVYLLGAGATFIGLLLPILQRITLGLMVAVSATWLWRRYRSGWVWHHTPLDAVLVVWAMAFLVSILANPETWRRSFIGLWYVGAYVGVWYLLYDSMTNRGVQREMLLDALMFGGLIVLVSAYRQAFVNGIDFSESSLRAPGGTIGNPNSLGTVLIVLTMISMARFLIAPKGLARLVTGGYSAATSVLLFLIFSRGAWIGSAAAFAILALLALRAKGMLSIPALRASWQRQSSSRKTLLAGTVLILAAIGVIMAVLLALSTGFSGRSPQLRLRIYQDALEIIQEKPLSGHGLYTFGQELARKISVPPKYPHSHAHNIILHVQAELGALGSLALLLTVGVLIRAMVRNWRNASQRVRLQLAGIIAAIAGFGVHNLLDTTVMMPIISILGITLLVLATTPADPTPVSPQWRRRGQLTAVAGVWGALIITGFWSAHVNATYYNALEYVFPEEGTPDYRGGADRMQAAIDADPELAIYRYQQAFLYGFAADQGDTEALQLAIDGFERFLEFEPDHAMGWANLAALYWQGGRQQPAIDALNQARMLAPASLPFHFQLARYAESAGQEELARSAYRSALADPQIHLWPEWDDTPLSRQAFAQASLTGEDRLVFALADHQHVLGAADAETLWSASGFRVGNSTQETVLRLILVLRSELDADTLDLLAQAEALAQDDQDAAWVYLGQAEFARFYGDPVTAQARLDLAYVEIEPNLGAADFGFGSIIAVFQFLRSTTVRQFLPQFHYPATEPALLYLLASFQD